LKRSSAFFLSETCLSGCHLLQGEGHMQGTGDAACLLCMLGAVYFHMQTQHTQRGCYVVPAAEAYMHTGRHRVAVREPLAARATGTHSAASLRKQDCACCRAAQTVCPSGTPSTVTVGLAVHDYMSSS
jgi:hypothetical protein